jgi:hypothetical protein
MVFMRLLRNKREFHFSLLPYKDLRKLLANSSIQTFTSHSVPDNLGLRFVKDKIQSATTSRFLGGGIQSWKSLRGSSYRGNRGH